MIIHEVVKRLEDDEKGMSLIHTPGGDQNMSIINERTNGLSLT